MEKIKVRNQNILAFFSHQTPSNSSLQTVQQSLSIVKFKHWLNFVQCSYQSLQQQTEQLQNDN